ncbi:MAG TPA: prolyl oligopeptidase family serine peptidase [Longimicrobiales bacterium]
MKVHPGCVRTSWTWPLLLAALAAAAPVAGQQRPVEPEDYGRFESLGTGTLSPDGRWLAYAVNRVDEQNELRVRMVARDSTIVIAYGGGASFSPDSRWLAYSIGVSPAERERLTAEKKPVRNRVGVIDLASGTRVELGEAASFELSPDGSYLAVRAYEPEDRRGADLIVRDLARATNVSFGNVSAFGWAPDGALLAIVVETETGVGNAVQLYDAASGALRVLDTSTSLYRGLAWRDDARDLAVLRTVTDSAYRDTTHVVLAWRGLGRADAARTELDPARAPGFPQEMRIPETRVPEWSEDGSIVMLGLRPRTPAPARAPRDSTGADTARADADGKPSDVQVWHARDLRILPQQKSQEQQDLRRTLLAVWPADSDRLVRIGTDLQETARVLEDPRHATETDRSRHAFGAMFGRPGLDVWLIDTRTGERRRALEDVTFYQGASATGRYLLWFDGADYWTYDIATSRRTKLSAGADATFADEQYDYPVDRLPPHGVAGWTRGDSAVLVYDRYDVWSLAPDGSGGRRLTNGAGDRVIHRLADVEDTDDGIDMLRPLYFTARGERTKQGGWARLRNGTVEPLLLEDARLLRLVRADSAEVFAFTRERFDDAPDWFVADGTLRNARQVSRINSFQQEYAWGRAELVDFTSEAGLELQAVLLYPAAYEPSRRHPMIVYTYEQLSQNLHNYVVPSERSYYNFNVFTAEGYFVLMPDIVYRGREPGVSALEAVVPAVQAVVQRGVVDPERIGLIGHSWGGYQATYLPTRTDIFAAAVAGAPITNFLSFAGAIHWTPGIPEFSHWETGQARMGVPFWEDLDAYLRNSPAHMVHELETPMLMMFGDADGTVDWHQGVEFYNFARRAGREDFVLLVYPGEDHGLRKRENQIDYHRRILQWFGHWLKGEPPARWITEGTTWLQRKQILENGR